MVSLKKKDTDPEKGLNWPDFPPKVEAFPKPEPGTPGGWLDTDSLPEADIVVITWTSTEWKALNDVLTAKSKPEKWWYPYTKNFYKVYHDLWNHRMINWHNNMSLQTPCLDQRRGGSNIRGKWGDFCLISIGNKRVLLFHSVLHLNTDGRMIPLETLLEQIIDDTKPYLVLSVGTAGGVDVNDHLGDVVITSKGRFYLSDEFSDADFNNKIYESPWKPNVSQELLTVIQKNLMKKLDEGTLWIPNSEYSKLIHEPISALFFDPKIRISDLPIITTDRFEFGTTNNNLDKIGCAVEMGDAFVGRVCHSRKIKFGFIRNISDSVINAALPRDLQGSYASEVYSNKGYETSWNSSVAVWAVIVGEQKSQKQTNGTFSVTVGTPLSEKKKQPPLMEVLPSIVWEEGIPKPVPLSFPDPPDSIKHFSKYSNFYKWIHWAPLPKADVLVFIWSEKTLEALDHIFFETHKQPDDPRQKSHTDEKKWLKNWRIYNRNSHQIFHDLYLQKQLQRDHRDYLTPEGLHSEWRNESDQLGVYRFAEINSTKVVAFHSNLSVRTDGATLPVEQLVKQAISEVKPKLVLCVGTAGAVREKDSALGSVLISNSARFLLDNEFIGYPFNGEVFGSKWIMPMKYIPVAEKKMKAVEWPPLHMPSTGFDLSRPPIIPSPQQSKIHVENTPVITAPRRLSFGFFYSNLFEFGTMANNIDLLGCAVDLQSAVVARQCELSGIDCGFVNAISVPLLNTPPKNSNLDYSWVQVFEQNTTLPGSINASIVVWAIIAGMT